MAWARQVGIPLLCSTFPYVTGYGKITKPLFRGPAYYSRRRMFPNKRPRRRLIMRDLDAMFVKVQIKEIECARSDS
jgi:hypothetical protein